MHLKAVLKNSILALMGSVSLSISGQVFHVEPPNWWVGFKDPTLQIMIHGKDLKDARVELVSEYARLTGVRYADSPNYLFVDLQIPVEGTAETAVLKIRKGSGDTIEIPYEFRERSAEGIEGFNSSDAIYLITPDRFANANPKNDSFPDLRERGIDRNHDYARHGGDIEGIISHLDYINDMGFTAIWSSPLLENDMPEQSYHGYAITDFYKVDPRFGTLEDYKTLAVESRSRGIKMIMDQVVNHCGRFHWWMEDLPFSDWLNYQDQADEEEVRTTNHRRTTNQDPYASKADSELMQKGWFVSAMPDLNQQNPFMATYLIQNSIWWIETLGLGGIRQDTYPYPDKGFLSDWARRIMDEYPEFSIVGEEWSYNPLLVGYWQSGANNRDGYESHLKSTMDFPLQKVLVESLNEDEGWDSGLNNLYEALANDFYYPRPQDIMLFPDNHDMDRIYTQLGEDPVKTKMAIAFIALAPRIPQFYYGTEILMQNTAKPGDHGLIRTDFPGGWKGDKVDAFTGKNLPEAAKDMQVFMKTLLNFRKNSPAIHSGETIHFAPENGTYVLFRSAGDDAVVLLLNKNKGETVLPLNRFDEIGLKGKTLRNIISGSEFPWEGSLVLPEEGAYIFTTRTE